MNVTMAISINCEIEVNIRIHAPALLSVCQNSYYEMIFIVDFISLFYRYHCRYVRLFYHDICSFYYSRSNTSEILQLYTCLHFSSYYKYTSTNMNFIVVLIKIPTMGRTTNWWLLSASLSSVQDTTEGVTMSEFDPKRMKQAWKRSKWWFSNNRMMHFPALILI